MIPLIIYWVLTHINSLLTSFLFSFDQPVDSNESKKNIDNSNDSLLNDLDIGLTTLDAVFNKGELRHNQ